MSTLPSHLQRRQRMRGWAVYGVTLVSIVVIIVVVQLVGHEASDLAAKINQGLAR